ncbi:hypothetical protein SSBR45G_72400 [Bradyrhizobium sp. SSBR45G]|nr:hypothetical protein SSBR45G_72400 [Bradyrhizobium sp. SSBR45G]GLH89768.1 hypothetical protein SSBR45R_72290 [Bradyrhizobium sp. SSBR45R]
MTSFYGRSAVDSRLAHNASHTFAVVPGKSDNAKALADADPGPILRGRRGWARKVGQRASHNSLGLWIPDRRALAGQRLRVAGSALVRDDTEYEASAGDSMTSSMDASSWMLRWPTTPA